MAVCERAERPSNGALRVLIVLFNIFIFYPKENMYADLNKSSLKRRFEPNLNDFEVNINDASEVRRWMQHWDVTEAELRKTVAEVGTEVDAVRIALGK